MRQNETLINNYRLASATASTSFGCPRPAGGAKLLPAPRRSNPQTNVLTDLLTDLLTDWMIMLTICAKASRARGNLRRAKVLCHPPTPAAPSARQESQPARPVTGWGLDRAAHRVVSRPIRRN